MAFLRGDEEKLASGAIREMIEEDVEASAPKQLIQLIKVCHPRPIMTVETESTSLLLACFLPAFCLLCPCSGCSVSVFEGLLRCCLEYLDGDRLCVNLPRPASMNVCVFLMGTKCF